MNIKKTKVMGCGPNLNPEMNLTNIHVVSVIRKLDRTLSIAVDVRTGSTKRGTNITDVFKTN